MMYGMFLIYSFNNRSLAAILLCHLGFQNFYFDCGVQSRLCTILDPKQVTMHQNESFRMIDGQKIGILRI